MNQKDLVLAVAQKTNLSKSEAKKAVDATINSIQIGVNKGERVRIVGFGTFSLAKRKARVGRNPHTGEKINIKARSVPKFKPSSTFESVKKVAKKAAGKASKRR